jgi:hypothetical protein
MSVSRRSSVFLVALICTLVSSSAHASPTQPVSGFSVPARFGAVNCTPTQLAEVQAAADEAKRMLIRGGTATQFMRWFGPLNNSQASLDVQNVVQYVRLFSLESLTLLGAAAREFATRGAVTIDCNGGFTGRAAHIRPGGMTIFIDRQFWDVLDKNPRIVGPQHSSRASVLIHELSHVAGTGDFAVAFGYREVDSFEFAMDLVRLLPANTIFNADNYEYFYNGQ